MPQSTTSRPGEIGFELIDAQNDGQQNTFQLKKILQVNNLDFF